MCSFILVILDMPVTISNAMDHLQQLLQII